jgi:hypothetical protein
MAGFIIIIICIEIAGRAVVYRFIIRLGYERIAEYYLDNIVGVVLVRIS